MRQYYKVTMSDYELEVMSKAIAWSPKPSDDPHAAIRQVGRMQAMLGWIVDQINYEKRPEQNRNDNDKTTSTTERPNAN